MLEEKENQEVTEPKSDEVITEEGVKIENDEDIAKVREKIEENVVQENSLDEKRAELFKKALEEASMPVLLTNDKFKLGESELDIRKLSKPNKEQMQFRQGVLNVVYLKQILSSLIDVTRLLMVIADKIGVENIVKATDDIIEKAKEQNDALKGVLKDTKDKKQDA